MPQPGVHLLLARQTLDRWTETPTTSPFDASDARLANAFLQGALGPDMGFYPGGPQRLSERVHAGGSGALVRALIEHAATPHQEAFAWGWLTHVVADVLMHPIINRGADELAHARGTRDEANWLVAHVQIEVGLDAVRLRGRAHRRLRLRGAFVERELAFLARALDDVYGDTFTAIRLAASLRNVTRFTNACLPFVAAVGRSARAERAGRSFWTPTRHILARWVGRRAPAHGFLVPVLPARAFLRSIAHAWHEFHEVYQHAVAARAAGLLDHDLNSGLPCGGAGVGRTQPADMAAALAAAG